jgi:hypothetical protein
MEEAILKAPTDSAAAAKVSAAFGKDWQSQHDVLKQTITDMKSAKMTMKDTDPGVFDGERGRPARAAHEPKTGLTKFRTTWHNENELHRAGVMIHELSHQVAKTGDHVVASNNKFVNNREAKSETGVNKKAGCKFPFISFPLITSFC